jgi:hypothetical protein
MGSPGKNPVQTPVKEQSRDKDSSGWLLSLAATQYKIEVARMSAFGTKRTSQAALSMSAIGGKADIGGSGLLRCNLAPEPHSAGHKGGQHLAVVTAFARRSNSRSIISGLVMG